MIDEAEVRAAILAEAISWERTPYHPHARLKGVGVDCAQFPVAVYSEAGCMPVIEPEYSQQWMLHRDEEIYLQEIRRFARDIPMEEAQPGDLIVWKLGRTYSHSAIIIELPIVIHAVSKGRAVLRSDIEADQEFAGRPRLAFSVFRKDGGGFVYSGEEG